LTGTDTTARSPEPPGEWHVLTASALGAAHLVTGQPIQDAVAARRIDAGSLVVAVGDGHGNQRHFRSARGSQLAVDIGCDAAARFATGLVQESTADQIEEHARVDLVPDIVSRWREAVLSDLAVAPFSGPEQAVRAPGDTELIAYGSTLLLALVWRHWIVLAQIGDGDVVAIRPDGGALRPVPDDPALDGHQTTSLCGLRPEDDFRVRAIDMREVPLLGLLIATDGYGNAQAADPWADAVSADLAKMIGKHEPWWFAEQLPTWASVCASADGSGDDTTVALLIAPDAAQMRQRAELSAPVPPPAGSDGPTAPTVRLGSTAVAGQESQVHRAASRPPGRRPTLLVAASVVIVAALAIVGIVLASSHSPRRAACQGSNSACPTRSAPTPASSASPNATGISGPGSLGKNGNSTSTGVTHAGTVHAHLPGTPQRTKAFTGGTLAVLHNQLWWCRNELDHCRELASLATFHLQPRLEVCGTGAQVTVDLPARPAAGRPAGVRLTFDRRTDVVRTTRLRTLSCR
jgi:Protein phosphatase 2C